MPEAFDPHSLRGCVAIAVGEASDLSATVSAHFGRSPRFLVVRGGGELSVDVIDNPQAESTQGAGPATASLLRRKGVTAVLAGQFGRKAEDALRAGGIQPLTVRPGTEARKALAGLEAVRGRSES